MDNHAHAALRTRYFRFFRHQNLLSDLVRRRQCWLEHPAGSGDEQVPGHGAGSSFELRFPATWVVETRPGAEETPAALP